MQTPNSVVRVNIFGVLTVCPYKLSPFSNNVMPASMLYF